MSRSKHALKSEQWYGGWAQYIRNENRDARKFGLHKAEQNRARIEAEQVALELDADACADADDREADRSYVGQQEALDWDEYQGTRDEAWSYDEDPWYGDTNDYDDGLEASYTDDAAYYAEVCPCASCLRARTQLRAHAS